MTCRAYFGWDHGRIGTATFAWTDGGGAHTASIATGTYAHIDFAFFTTYTDFATAWQAALNAVSAGNTVTWSNTTMQYTWSRAGAFTIDAGTNALARQISGFSTLPSASLAVHTSHVRPYYVVACEHGGVSDADSPGVERGGHTTVRYSGRKAYSWTNADVARFQSFAVRLETKAATFREYAAGSVPWTWQHGIEHARATEPVVFKTDLEERVYMLTEQGANWNPDRVKRNWDGRFDVPFDAQWIGKA